MYTTRFSSTVPALSEFQAPSQAAVLHPVAVPDSRSQRAVSDTVTSRRNFPSAAVAAVADTTLHKRLVQWLTTGSPPENLIPPNASIAPFLQLYNAAITEPAVQAWFEAKGLKLSTVRVFRDSVAGMVTREGKDTFERFTLTDGSGWWEVSTKIHAIQQVLSPNDLGVPVAMSPTQSAVPRDVVLDFYGVRPPLNERAAAALGTQLKREGWPAISSSLRDQWEKQFKRLLQQNDDQAVRRQLVGQLQPMIEGKEGGESLKLDDHTVSIARGSTLDQLSQEPRKQFNAFLATPTFQDFLANVGDAGEGRAYRLSEGALQMRNAAGQWQSLQAYFDEEIQKALATGSEEAQQSARQMNSNLDDLLRMSGKTGNALYSTRTYDARQALAFYAPDAPQTVSDVRATLSWFNTSFPPPLSAGDYAVMLPYEQSVGAALSADDREVLKGMAPAVVALLGRFTGSSVVEQSPHDPDRRLADFFDSPPCIAKADELAKRLKLYAVADGQPLSKAKRHQLLAAALKLSVNAPVPGRPGVVAGYWLYQPGNLGRTLKDVRQDVEKHLESKGVDATLSSLFAHLFLAQSAPEMLIKADPGVPTEAAQAFNRDPQSIKIGSTGWLEMRLGCAIADALSGAGSSRLMNLTQIMALARLDAGGATQEALLKILATRPLLDWAVMTGIFPMTHDNQYSPGDYQAATQAFTAREKQIREAFSTLTKEPPTQRSLLIERLLSLFPEMTADELRGFRLELDTDVPFEPRQHAHLESRRPLLTDVILTEQVRDDPLLAVDHWLNARINGERRYRFIHPRISQATFEARIRQVPEIAPLVAAAVDQHIADTRVAQATALKLMIAQLPAQERLALESGNIEFFTVRQETGEALEDDQGPDSKVDEHCGKHGLLLRYETGAVEPRFCYYEVFPRSMQMVKRTDLPYRLKLDGAVEEGRKPHGPFAYVRRPFRLGTEQAFDVEAYRSGSLPRAGAKSKVIIEKVPTELPPTPQLRPGDRAIRRVPDTFASTKTQQIVSALLAHSFDGKRATLIEFANQPPGLQSRRTYPFTSGTQLFNAENARMMLSLIPFVGAISDVAHGNVKDGLKGLLIDFASFAATGGLSGVSRFLRGVKKLVLFNGKSFSLPGLKGTAPLLRSLFNPLDGTIDVFKSGSKTVDALRKIRNGEVARLAPGLYMPTTAFEKCRWAVGVQGCLFPGGIRSFKAVSGARTGNVGDLEVQAIQKNAGWYVINPSSGEPEGAPLKHFRVRD
ncbi:hypothetical protein [Pseudomonas sp. S3E17]|uniref:hypothetical protein n=1 Tax=Pseudomonas sp. S3E17 TaxID=2817893 RepID=UPI0020A1BF15|nr:hypothetical protein [Pseudomonas sp. S3E17]MCP1462938.1 hypothetical protein [Pseudomonas sp. S3E17]